MRDLCNYCNKEYKKREKKRKFCSITCANRFNLNGSHKITLPIFNSQLAEFIGICLGDGSTGVYQIGITLNARADIDYIPYVYRLSQTLFPGAGVALVQRKDNAVDVRITSKTVVLFLKENGIIAHAKYVPEWIKQNAIFTHACIRGLFDTEGSVSKKMYVSKTGLRTYYQLNFRNTNKKIMLFVRDGLLAIGLSPTTSLANSLYLSNPSSISTFRSRIGFSNPKLVEKCSTIA